MRKGSVLIVLCSLALLQACGDPRDPYTDDNPTSGHILILADEDLRAIVEEEEMVFESIYDKAQIDVRYLPEAELLKAMMNDSVRCVISTVLPGGDQQAYLDKRTIKPRPVAICTDGIAVVVNKGVSEADISMPRLVGLLQPLRPLGMDVITWEKRQMPLVAGTGSGVIRALVDSLGDRGLIMSGMEGTDGQAPMNRPTVRASALNSIEEVIARVSQDPNVVGLLPFAAISDLDDPHVRQLRDQVRLIAVSGDSGQAVLPSQSTLADRSYPLRRTVYMVLTEGKSGLGTGFVSFVANHKGQRIILKKGLAPQKVPSREVEVVTH
jgi:phosphate transport system substrate-binding protein